MIRILIGPKGTGKTKTFINMVNEALSTEKGNVVCITKLISCDLNDINNIISDLEVLSEKFNVDFTLAISSEATELPTNISKYKF